MNFLFNVNFWGERYTRFFLDYGLPSQLAAGNIPYMLRHNKGAIRYRIYTTREDAALVVNSSAYASLCRLVETEIVDLDDFDLYNHHNRGTMTLCHAHAIQYANAHNYSLLFIWPDIIFSCNALGTLFNLAVSGKTSVFVGSLAVHTGKFLEELGSKFVVKDGALTIPPRELVAMGMNNLCIQSEQWKWNSPYFNKFPSWIFWEVPGEGLLQRAFHLTPLLLTPDDKDEPLVYDPNDELGLDGNDYLGRAMHDISSMYVLEDSDDFFIASLNDDIIPQENRDSTVTDVALYARQIFKPYHIGLFMHKIRFHSLDLSPEWDRIESSSDHIVQQVIALLQLLYSYPDMYLELHSIRQNAALQGKLNEAATELYKIGRHFSCNGSWREAEQVFLKLLELDPCFIEPNMELARIYTVNGNYEAAFRHVHYVLQRDPENSDARCLADSLLRKGMADNMQLARISAVNGNYVTAFQYLLKILQHDSENSDARCLADSLLKKGLVDNTPTFNEALGLYGSELRKLFEFQGRFE